ncbi:hypothetical protein NHH73_26375 [Oxalobacteraceae bacterium OTU3CINTB1]|nr:hypothetical protein NHH73_26375 [Oxalobacteraceae bacterium OTU3CINTB1]
MEFYKILWLSVALILCSRAGAQSIPDHLARYIADQMLNNVVIVEGTRLDETPILGLGMIMARQGDLLWVATAGHVIFDQDHLLTLPYVPSVKVLTGKLRDGSRWAAALPPERTTDVDLAFLALKVPFGETGPDSWREGVEILEPKVGTKVRLAGLPDKIAYGGEGASISAVDTHGNIEFAGLMGVAGRSGAPVATKDGFVGIYVQSAGNRVVPMSVIKAVALGSNRPYGLSPTRAAPSAVRVCLVNSSGDAYMPQLIGPEVRAKPDKDGCVATLSGAHFLAAAPGTDCEPHEFSLSDAPVQTIRFKCSVDPEGVWVSAQSGYLSVKKLGENLWSVEGLSQSQYGQLNGLLRGAPPTMQLELRTPVGLAFFGSIVLQPQKLKGNLAGSAGILPIEVSR